MNFGRARQRRRSLAVDLTPMVDVVFQLLVFFLTTAQMADMARSDIDLPRERGEDDRAVEQAGLVVNVLADGTIIVSGETVSLDELEAMAITALEQAIAEGRGGLQPMIRADRTAGSAHLNDVFETLRRSGFQAVRIATDAGEADTMRFRVSDRRRGEGFKLDMSSMIDVTFLLLSFFLVTTASTRPENRLTPTLRGDRESESGPATDFQPQVVEVIMSEGAPAFRLGSQLFRERPALTDALRALRKDAGLYVRVSDAPPVAAAAAALQAGRDAGFEQVTYVPMR